MVGVLTCSSISSAQQPAAFTEIPIAAPFDLASTKPESRAQLNQVKQNINQTRAQLRIDFPRRSRFRGEFYSGEGGPSPVQMTNEAIKRLVRKLRVFTHAKSMGELATQRLTFLNELNTRCPNDAVPTYCKQHCIASDADIPYRDISPSCAIQRDVDCWPDKSTFQL